MYAAVSLNFLLSPLVETDIRAPPRHYIVIIVITITLTRDHRIAAFIARFVRHDVRRNKKKINK